MKPFTTQYTLRIKTSDEHWVIDWSLDESEDYDRFGVEDGHGWMRRLVPLRDYRSSGLGESSSKRPTPLLPTSCPRRGITLKSGVL
ncbi:MAG: hypothetical protein IPN53_06530 [Comamonadaceae bacterium]|nr:hypothetical protein [Comamonadaceae bacterium]